MTRLFFRSVMEIGTADLATTEDLYVNPICSQMDQMLLKCRSAKGGSGVRACACVRRAAVWGS